MKTDQPPADPEPPVHEIAGEDVTGVRLLIIPLVVLSCGHMLSNLLRTIPAIAIDMMAANFGTSAQALASLAAVYHFSFAASQIPVGAALDRFGVRTVSLCLLAGTVCGSVFSALSNNPAMFVLGQIFLGVSTSGMLMCPMTLAAKRLPVKRFGLWSGVVLSLGNMGMLLSSSPLAWVVEGYGWRSGFWISGLFGILIAGLVWAFVPGDKPEQSGISPLKEMVEVVHIGLSRSLRGIVALSLVSLAASLVLRGLWGGPWLMEIKGLGRIAAGNVLGIFTLAMIVGPLLMGAIDRRFGHRRAMIAVTHLLAAGFLILMAAGAPNGFVSRLFGLELMPAQYDTLLFFLIGIVVSAQPLIYAMTRQIVTVANTGKALAAVNLAFFLGSALMQSITGFVAAQWNLPAVLMSMAAALIVGSLLFLAYSRASAD